MRDFDSELASIDERTVKLGGETFVIRPAIRPEHMREWDDLNLLEADHEEILRVMDDLIVRMFEPQGDSDDVLGRWRSLRERDDRTVGLSQMFSLIRYCVEVQTGRPTSAPSSSDDGRETTTPTSTGSSPHLAAI